MVGKILAPSQSPHFRPFGTLSLMSGIFYLPQIRESHPRVILYTLEFQVSQKSYWWLVLLQRLGRYPSLSTCCGLRTSKPKFARWILGGCYVASRLLSPGLSHCRKYTPYHYCLRYNEDPDHLERPAIYIPQVALKEWLFVRSGLGTLRQGFC